MLLSMLIFMTPSLYHPFLSLNAYFHSHLHAYLGSHISRHDNPRAQRLGEH
jgi:hypothetical protein